MQAHFKTLQTVLFISLIVAATALFVWLVNDYLLSVFWASVFAILFYPLFQRLRTLVRGSASVASLLTMAIILCVVLIPTFILGSLVVNESRSLYDSLANNTISTERLVEYVGPLAAPLAQFGIEPAALEARAAVLLEDLGTRIAGYALSAGRTTVQIAIGTLLMLYVLFFALRDGERIMQRVMRALPLGNDKERMLFARFTAIVRAMFKGTFIIAIIQGALGGLLFAAVGIPSAVLWAFVMGVLALIPAVGPALIWIPAAFFLFTTGQVAEAVIVVIVGTVVIGLIDNVLRPILVAKDTAMSDVLVMLSVIGGITTFGIAGIIIGPVIAAFFLAMWQLFEHDYADELKRYG